MGRWGSDRLRQDGADTYRPSEHAQEAANSKTRSPACSWCERLGDTIIALQAERGARVVTADRTFVPLGELLGQTITLLPSLAELKRRNEQQGETGEA